MWTIENCARYDRSRLRYPSDLTDEEWALVRPQIPRAKRGGNKRSVDERALICRASMAARKSRARNGTSWSTRRAC